MTPADGFEATFTIRADREAAWRRLTGDGAPPREGDQLWLPGFDSTATIVESDPSRRLHATKAEEPCAGTQIVVTLEDEVTGTRIHVVQSRFGDWSPAGYDMMAIGWRHLVADLETYLATGVHACRHLRTWGDLGAAARPIDGGIRVEHVRPDGLAHRLGIVDGDLLVTLAGAPIASLDDLATVLRVLLTTATEPTAAEWIRSGSLMKAGSDGGI